MLIVYLSNRYIRVAVGDAGSGRITAKSFYYTVDTQGCILNGTITDEEGLSKLLDGLWSNYVLPKQDVYLLLDSTQFTTRIIEAPVQKPKQMLEYVQREFLNVGRMTAPVYDYFTLPEGAGQAAPSIVEKEDKKSGAKKKNKLANIFATAVQRDFILQYIRLFEKIGVTVSGAGCASEAVIKLLGFLPETKGKTCIVQMVDDMNLENVLLVEGVYKYSNRNRIFSDPGTPGYAVEIARAVSNIMQFAKTQGIEESLNEVFITGLSKDDEMVYLDSITQMNASLNARALGGSSSITVPSGGDAYTDFGHFAVLLGAMLKTTSKSSLVKQVTFDPVKEKEKQKRKRMLMPAIALGALLVIITAAMGIRYFMLTSELKAVNDYNNDPTVKEACTQYDTLLAQVNTENQLLSSMKGLQSAVLAYPMPDSTVSQVISRCASGLVTAQVVSYNSASGVMTFSTSASSVDNINQFIAALCGESVFAAVDYTGYAQSSDGTWNVNVSCTLAERQVNAQ